MSTNRYEMVKKNITDDIKTSMITIRSSKKDNCNRNYYQAVFEQDNRAGRLENSISQ